MKADEAASELARATAQYERRRRATRLRRRNAPGREKCDLGVRRGALESELAALSKDAEKMTAEREMARRRHV